MSEPLQPVKGSWDLEIKWAEGTTDEQIKEFQRDYLEDMRKEISEADVPPYIVGFDFKKVL